MSTTTGRSRPVFTPIRIGILVTLIGLVFGAALFGKDRIITTLTPGETVTANFPQQYGLQNYTTRVKVAGVPVGKVVDVEQQDDGTALVTMKVDHGTTDRVGTTPSAEIRPTTLLGGGYYLEIVPGGPPGTWEGEIPLDRTAVPVELDKVAAALQPDALRGLQNSTGNLDQTLAEGGGDALKELTATAPATLGPAGGVLESVRGTRPEVDLTELVRGLESTSQALAEHDGELDSVVSGLDTLSATLDRRGGDISTALGGLPETLRQTDAGLKSLDGTLGQLRETAGPAQASVEQLDSLLGRTDPVLAKARPVVNDLRGVLVDARPLVDDLVPASSGLTTVLDNLHGPVLDRVNGPVLDTVNGPFQGTGPYEGGGGDNPLYQELAHMVTNLDSASALTDENGAVIGFNPGVNGGTVAGLPGVSVEQLFANLANFKEIQR
ncbi:MlaD family protein [Pseudonocardia sp. WMMC193]|uniref:MlaD family protein n=1 Tax=Pseudonocardia sp. WMMC193 TaxID=2911965 RepID=UPI001F39D95A|nr:MlaD family protein [Pseudonocardia sp. WMMC193]MCF7550727.1 MlaD family protein [Pseudonocardia sp. WMMC193]